MTIHLYGWLLADWRRVPERKNDPTPKAFFYRSLDTLRANLMMRFHPDEVDNRDQTVRWDTVLDPCQYQNTDSFSLSPVELILGLIPTDELLVGLAETIYRWSKPNAMRNK